jgi:hypothetical protein
MYQVWLIEMNFLLNERPVLFLQSICKNNTKKGINKLGKDCYSTYKSRYNNLMEFERLGYITLERGGREVIPIVTKRGREAMAHISFFF